MGTRSTYRVIEQYTDEKKNKVVNEEICLMYLQFDGYPSGHPSETAKWLASGMVVNGFGANEKRLIFNGAGCLAAQLVHKYKDGAGGCYLHSLKSRGKSWEDYLYDIIVKEDASIEFVCYENGRKKTEVFRGNPADFVLHYGKKQVV
jgi:hypothetical protein